VFDTLRLAGVVDDERIPVLVDDMDDSCHFELAERLAGVEGGLNIRVHT
jgi:hypothetical protein